MQNLLDRIKYRAIMTAGGNAIGIVRFPDASRRSEYALIANYFMPKNPLLQQFGFLEGSKSFYMSGEEFSANGVRAAAWLLYQLTGKSQGTFTASGLSNPVKYFALSSGCVQCDFEGLALVTKRFKLSEGVEGTLVDFGGICHFVLDKKFKFYDEPNYYRALHEEVMGELNLGHKPAFGVIWQRQLSKGIGIDPVVRVSKTNSCCYETACGSGTLAILEASGLMKLLVSQPSGKFISVFKNCGTYSLISEVQEIVTAESRTWGWR